MAGAAWVAVAAGALHAASLALGAAANALALLAFYRRRRRVALSDRFVVNLLLGGVVTALWLPPLALVELVGAGGGAGAGGGPPPGLCAAAEAASAVAASLPPLAVLLLAGDQALAVLQPLRYRARLDTPRAAGLMLCAWALALAFGAASALAPPSPASLWRACRPCDGPDDRQGDGGGGAAAATVGGLQEPSGVSGYRAALASAGFALLFALPFAATALIYARISGAARRNSQQAGPAVAAAAAAAAAAAQNGSAGGGGGAGGATLALPTAAGQPPPGGGCGVALPRRANSSCSRSSLVSSIRSRLSNASALGASAAGRWRGRRPESRAARVSALVVALALGCWLPWHALALARALAPDAAAGAVPRWADAFALALLSAASPLAPGLFAFRSRRLRRELRRVLRLPSASAHAPGAGAGGGPHGRPLLPPAGRRSPPPASPSPPPAAAAAFALLPPPPTDGPRGSFSSAASTQGTTSTED